MIARVLGSVGAVVVGVLVVMLGYAVFIEPQLLLEERHHEAEIPHLDEAWEGETIAVVSDFQVGMWFANTDMAEQAVEQIVEERPAAVLLAGDFLYSQTPDAEKQVETVMDALAPLVESGIPSFAVLGNHDYESDGAAEMTAALEAAGIRVLSNDAAIVPLEGSDVQRPLWVVGIAPAHAGLADIDTAFAGVSAEQPRVVMMHNPQVFPRIPADAAPLAVAGHTHCGQFAMPGSPHSSWMALTTEDPMVADGYAPDDFGAEGNMLYVTCGIGFSGIPARFNAPPQVVYFELVAANGG
ncbi:metallophosphoesterase [Microbacterium sp. LRZ72]|uniref:metallophosphoesterase n=1 Tax=Microbacterium sp. LRZ72 TaxID=2942481 RepID=UPI0029B43B9C|nr:metallophosphoesterase [Microbacterium sp. LRZ72]MDX2377851.1 metallophosphoesterase [Microbacterium sp. LRZ72]